MAKNHMVTQSTFASPCQNLARTWVYARRQHLSILLADNLQAWRSKLDDLLQLEGETVLMRWECVRSGTSERPKWTISIYMCGCKLASAVGCEREATEECAAKQAYARLIGDISAPGYAEEDGY
ncbi:hypothetical protein CERSUDRAFT_73770 [Gelatoporia subvermispora B]|uniref:DRBM domain-containing protein n=1 Tax=Ceriporiopsis subvermispora (strain B) TaxID=914234 RepID=M2QI51_CERS8|nr:hypothetical protein CERSUDRAFT_73770 [Gelatoporia subvermispora B]